MEVSSPPATEPGSEQREKRPRALLRCWPYLALALILAGALYLRWENNSYGLPAIYHPDERRKVAVISRFFSEKTADPDYFKHPAFLLYTVAASGWAAHLVSGQALTGPTFCTAGRSWVGLLGGLTVLLTFLLTREAAGGRFLSGEGGPGGTQAARHRQNLMQDAAGLLAALFLAVSPLHVVISHYIKEDVPLALWSTLALVFYVRLARDGRRRDYLLATFVTGLALATKYSAVALLPIFMVAHIVYVSRTPQQGWPWGGVLRIPGNWKVAVPVAAAIGACTAIGHSAGTYVVRTAALALVAFFLFRPVPPERDTHWKWQVLAKMLLIVIGVLLVFLVVNPYSVLNSGRFIEDFNYERRHALRYGHHGIKVSPWDYFWGFHLLYSLAPGMGWSLLALALLSALGLLFVRRPGVRVLQLGALLLYLAHEASILKPAPNYERYMAPVLPALCALAGVGLSALAAKVLRENLLSSNRLFLRGAKTLLPAVALMLTACIGVGIAAIRSWRLVEQMRPDTRDLAAAWLRDELPERSVVSRTLYTGFPVTERGWILKPSHFVSEERPRLDLSTGFFVLETEPGGRKEPVRVRLTHVVLSSAFVGRFFVFEKDRSSRRLVKRAFYQRLMKEWGPPVKVFKAPWGPYGFNNPTIEIYRNPNPAADGVPAHQP